MTPTETQKAIIEAAGTDNVFIKMDEYLSCYCCDCTCRCTETCESFIVDVSKLHLLDEYEFRYVSGCFDSIVTQYKAKRKTVYYTSSLKYSMSDTPDWWDAICVEKCPEDVVVIDAVGELNY